MNLDHNFLQVSKLSEDQKKRSSPKMEDFFPPNSSEDQKPVPNTIQRSDADQNQIIGGDANVDHSQVIGGMQSNYLGGYIPPRRFRHSWLRTLLNSATPSIFRKNVIWYVCTCDRTLSITPRLMTIGENRVKNCLEN